MTQEPDANERHRIRTKLQDAALIAVKLGLEDDEFERNVWDAWDYAISAEPNVISKA